MVRYDYFLLSCIRSATLTTRGLLYRCATMQASSGTAANRDVMTNTGSAPTHRDAAIGRKFNTSITPENVNDLEAIIAYAKSVDSPIQVATYMFPPVRRDAGMVGQNHRLTPEEAALARVKADWLQNEPLWFLGQAERYRRFVPVTEEMLAKQAAAPAEEMHCRAGRCSFWVDWQGNIANCGMYPSVRFPLAGQSFAEAWKRVVEETNQVRYSPVCTNCPNYRLCHACIAMVYNECGDHSGRPDYLCRMNAAAARYYQEFAARLPADVLRGEKQPVEIEEPECGLDQM